MTKLCEQCNGRKAHHPSLPFSRERPPPPDSPEEARRRWPGGRWDHNDRAYTKRNVGLYVGAPQLRNRARKQARRMRDAFREGDWERAGYHAGRVMALRLEAYDR